MKLKTLCLAAISFCGLHVYGQSGCTDIQAQNYNPQAVVNDGSCTYAPTTWVPTPVTNLAGTMQEISGMVFYGGKLYGHNDSGGSPQFWEIDTVNGTVLRTITVKNTTLTDWEAMASSATHLFIGDFGNNAGSRTDLRILKIKWSDVQQYDSVEAEIISFHYPEQANFNPGVQQHNFDAEAMVYAFDSLHIFTKNWENQQTYWYTLPADSGSYAALLQDSLAVNGLITDASYEHGVLVLVGYAGQFYSPFTWLCFDDSTSFFGGNKRRFQMGTLLQMGQLEGVCFSHGLKGWMSSEAVSQLMIPPRLYAFDIGNFITPVFTSANTWNQPALVVYPNPTDDTVFIRWHEKWESVHIELMNSAGKTWTIQKKYTAEPGLDFPISLHGKPRGVYYLIIEHQGIKYKEAIVIR